MSPNIVQFALQTARAEAHLMFERFQIHGVPFRAHLF
jgi:hypothetical protein